MIRRSLFAIVLLAAGYLSAGLIGGVWKSSGAPPGSGAGVWLAIGPIHTDILLPLDEPLRARVQALADAGVPLDHPEARWLSVGWGSRAFYTATGSYWDLRPRTIWLAATGDDSVLRFSVTGAVAEVGGLRWMALSPAQLERLEQAILADWTGHDPVDAHLTPGDAFFPARSRFHLLRTCNVWVGEKMRQAGVSFGRWTPLTWSVALSASD